MSTAEQTPAFADPVERAIRDLERHFRTSAMPAGNGGALVTVHDLAIGARWSPSVIDLLFELAYNYPHAPIYPYYTTSALTRSDGSSLPQALQRVSWRDAERTQISLRANRWNPLVDTAAGSVVQVQRWFEAT